MCKFPVRCEADNGYARDSASVSVSVENIVVREECRDNPHFANCKLIVKARSVIFIPRSICTGDAYCD